MLTATLREALSTLRLHRLWTALTTFGIIWGTASVVLLVGWGVGVHGMVDRGIQKVGKNLVYVMAGRVGEDLTPAEERRLLFFDMDDIEALRQSARYVERVSADVIFWMTVRRGSELRNINVRGVEPDMRDLRGVRVDAGRFLSPDDLRFKRRVAVIGQKARERLFGPRPVLGQSFTLNGRRFTVVGLLAPVGTQLSRDGAPIDEQIWIPATTALTLGYGDRINKMVMRPPARELNRELQAEVRRILAERLHVSPKDEEAVFIVSMIDYLSGFDTVFTALRRFLFILSATTLAIGGIGVMNMMLVAVNERRREIGLRLAVGARRGDVVGQFLVETLVITLAGGAVGLSFGLLGCALLGMLPGELVPRPAIVPEVAVAAVVVTTVVGLAAGVAPAWQAARVDPAESLRTE
jgi:putative ABC transport system permease protein